MDWVNKFKWLLGRTVVLLAVFVVLAHVSVNYDKTRLKALNDAQPSFAALVDFAVKPTHDQTALIEPYTRYFKIAVSYLPKGPTPNAMLGYCYYYSGNKIKALRLLRRSTTLIPKCFWFYYNTAVIYFNDRQVKEAARYLQMALDASPQESARLMMTSKIYSDLLNLAVERHINPAADLGRGYARAHEMLEEANQGNPQNSTYELVIF